MDWPFRLLWDHPLAVAGSIIVAISSLVVYRIYLHPLARYPGPKLAAATSWYATYYEVWKDGEFVEHIEDLHRRYGAPHIIFSIS